MPKTTTKIIKTKGASKKVSKTLDTKAKPASSVIAKGPMKKSSPTTKTAAKSASTKSSAPIKNPAKQNDKKGKTSTPFDTAKTMAKSAAVGLMAKAVQVVGKVTDSKKTAPVKPTPVKAGSVATSTTATAPISKAAAKTQAAKQTVKMAAKQIAGTDKYSNKNHDLMCRESGCENHATTKGFCRLDYIKNWKKIKRKEMILKEGKLNQYIEELVGKYPDKYIDIIRQDLSTEVNFNKVIHDLELDESIDDLEYDGDSIDSLIGAVRKDEGFDDTDF
jgi:hypothetical protein